MARLKKHMWYEHKCEVFFRDLNEAAKILCLKELIAQAEAMPHEVMKFLT
eukprot:CAMPEP_0185623622 /NCGR_PEP_ID=MMETSP0436-20130131/60001_1 /TAXON_ID=626734 ORGANISM="Favella taraikaensis, Strain Fe Narragansett Bay" /NCGR_SAMPLE_ID=MMETSP0436 /ASSEMBLY_ACC=CAM_ASM_000390 /LENGTH=49 /DNA_ID=CAMNT_0028265729 /DNA_START=621 /DNA_END=770 /DNA_ORIENTATION=-